MGTFKPRAAAASCILVIAFLDVLAMGIVVPVLPMLIEQFVGSTADAGVVNGLIIALWALMQFMAAPIIGSLSDHFGRRPVILMSAAGLAIHYVIMALAPDLWWLALGRVLAGATSASLTTVYAYVADTTSPEKRARGYGLLGAAYSGGFVAGPLLGGMLGEVSPRAPFWVAGALTALTVLYGTLVLPESLQSGYRMPFRWKRATPFGAWRLLRSHQVLTGLALINFLTYFAHHVFSTVFVLYAGYRYDWNSWEVGALFAAAGLLDVIVQGVLIGSITRRLGDRRTMITGLIGGSLGIACMGLAQNGLLFALAIVPNALRGLAVPTLQSLMTHCVAESEQGRLHGANMSLTSMAGVLSPLFFGAVYSVSIDNGSSNVSCAGIAFLLAAAVQLAAGIGGWRTAEDATVNSGRRRRDAGDSARVFTP